MVVGVLCYPGQKKSVLDGLEFVFHLGMHYHYAPAGETAVEDVPGEAADGILPARKRYQYD